MNFEEGSVEYSLEIETSELRVGSSRRPVSIVVNVYEAKVEESWSENGTSSVSDVKTTRTLLASKQIPLPKEGS